MKKLMIVLLFGGLLLTSCSKENAIISSEVSYDAAVLAVSVRVANESFDGSAEQHCGNASHYGLANLQVNVFALSDARSEDSRRVVAAGRTGTRGSVAFKDMELGTYTVQVTHGDISVEKTVAISEIKRVAVIMDF